MKHLHVRRAQFEMDMISDVFNGYTAGESWNGWACPYFEYREAIRVLEKLGVPFSYHFDTEEFVVDNEWSSETFGSQTVILEEQYPSETEIKVWSIGGWSWVWEELDTE